MRDLKTYVPKKAAPHLMLCSWTSALKIFEEWYGIAAVKPSLYKAKLMNQDKTLHLQIIQGVNALHLIRM